VLPVIACIDPMLDVSDGHVGAFHSRAVIHRGQTPQGFRLADLRRALWFCAEAGQRFDTLYEVVRRWDPDLRIRAIPGEPNNLKITVPFDHMIASHLLLDPQSLRLDDLQAG
jgi:2-C-methyl-D-erythritol 4-phosphate cytidylyltransferase